MKRNDFFKHFLLLVLWIQCCCPGHGQAPTDNYAALPTPEEYPNTDSDLLFKHLTVNDGFLRNSVSCILQDKNGLMWFGTWDGLYCYNGLELKLVCQSPISDLPNGQTINCILEDDEQNIWMGTSSGLALWNKNEEIAISHFSDGDSTMRILQEVLCLAKDSAANLWIGTASGHLYACDLKRHVMKDWSALFRDKKTVINDMLPVGRHSLLLATNHGLIKIARQGAGTASGQKEKWVAAPYSIPGLPPCCFISALFCDSKGFLWIGTKQTVYRYDFRSGAPAVDLKTAGNATGSQPQFSINRFMEQGNKLYGATNEGLFAYDLEQNTIRWTLPDYKDSSGLNDGAVQDICFDREGGMWLATFYGGVNYLSPTSGNFILYKDINQSIEGHVVSGICEDQYKNIWLSIEDRGFAQWNRKNNTVTNYTLSSHGAIRPTNRNVQTIYSDGEMIYVGTFNGGMSIINPRTNRQKNINAENSHPDKMPGSVYSFLKTPDGKILVGSLNGLFEYSPKEGTSRRVRPEIKGKVNCLAYDLSQNLWVSVLYEGLHCYNPKNKTWKHFKHRPGDSTSIASNDITTITPLGTNIYFGTQGDGLWMYDKETDCFSAIAKEILGQKIIFKIIAERNLLWITTNNGLYKYNLITRAVKHFTANDGLRSNLFKINSGIITSDGEIIVGSVNGLNCFRPQQINHQKPQPQIMLTDFLIFNEPVNFKTPGSPLGQSIADTRDIELNQKYNNITFKFASSSYADINKNIYEYQLCPIEKNWQRTHGLNNRANYTNLPAGEYTFRVRTSNGDGNWSEVRSLKLTVHPFWWFSLPMKILYLFIICSAIAYMFLRYRNKKRKEMQLFRIQKEQEVYQSKMEFFTCMVHEIRTPLSLVLGPLQDVMKRREATVNSVYPDLEVVERNGKRLLSLVNQLMDFRKVEEKSYNIEMESTDIKMIVEQSAHDFHFYNLQKNIRFYCDVPQEECWAEIDKEAFGKILYNLLSNAIKFTKDEIRVALKKNQEFWEISVTDNGKGIAQEEQKMIFKSFYQVRNNLPNDYIGTGIGLFVVQRLVELQHGKITVESNIGRGTTFTVRVRCSAPSVLQESVVKKNISIETSTGEMLADDLHKHILIAEDNDDMRAYLQSIFDDDYKVDTAPDGKVALQMTARHSYDLMITDIMMPEMDGIEFCKHLKSQLDTCHIPVIILTAKSDEDTQIESFESEADMYISKPFSAEVLKSRVKSVLLNRDHIRKKFYTTPEVSTEELCTNDTDKVFMEKFNQFIEANIAENNISMDETAREMAMGRTAFYQKVKAITNLSPNDYIRTVKLKKAAHILIHQDIKINEVSYLVGFSTPSYFTKRFSEQFGISPSEYQKAHRRTVVS